MKHQEPPESPDASSSQPKRDKTDADTDRPVKPSLTAESSTPNRLRKSHLDSKLGFIWKARKSASEQKDCNRLFLFVSSRIRQYHLEGVEESDIIHEAYIRALEKIKTEPINNPLPWLKTTCFNIIREKNRQQGKIKQVEYQEEYDLSQNDVTGNVILSNQFDAKIEALQEALKQLTPKEKEILHLRIIEELSWEEVTMGLSSNNGQPLKVDTVRQKGTRARRKIRRQLVTLEVKLSALSSLDKKNDSKM